MCREHAQYPAFALDTLFLLKKLDFFISLYFGVQNLPQLHMHAVAFCPIQFVRILLLEERCVQVQAL